MGSRSPRPCLLTETAAVVEIEPTDGGTGDGRRWALVELAGTTQPILVDAPADGRSILWSNDSRYAAIVSSGTLRIWDRDAGNVIDTDAGTDLRGLVAVDQEFVPGA